MKLEAGKYYRTRDGEKALVKYVDQNIPPEAHHDTRTCFGYVWWDDGSFSEWVWKEDGMYEGGERSGQDLVSEWTEPEEPKAIYILEKRHWKPTCKETRCIVQRYHVDTLELAKQMIDICESLPLKEGVEWEIYRYVPDSSSND